MISYYDRLLFCSVDVYFLLGGPKLSTCPAHNFVVEIIEFMNEHPGSGRAPLHVLVVDDEPCIHHMLEDALDYLGHTLTGAWTGEEAIAVIDEGLEPDVVILDMNMPGMGGRLTLPCIRKLRPALPVLISTGISASDLDALAESMPLVALLPKPYALHDLEFALERFR